MLKFEITTKEDLREAAVIAGRRRYEEERKARIFNGKQRLYGLDSVALDTQIKEKTKLQEKEAECERIYINEMKKRGNMLKAMELEQEREIKNRNADLNYFRCRYQRKDMTREFDLNDPNLLKNDHPARICDDDPRLGISSAQVFLGEDLNGFARRQAQRNQQKAWLDQQMRERKQAAEDRKRADAMIEQSLRARDQRLIDMSVAEREVQHKIKESILHYNQMLVQEKKANKKRVHQETQEDNLAEIYNMLGSDMLKDQKIISKKKVDPEDIRIQQKEQLKQNQQRKDEEKMKEAMWDQCVLNTERELILKERELKRMEKVILEEQVEANKILAQEQRARNDYFKNVVYKNQTTDEYWDQFNRTTR